MRELTPSVFTQHGVAVVRPASLLRSRTVEFADRIGCLAATTGRGGAIAADGCVAGSCLSRKGSKSMQGTCSRYSTTGRRELAVARAKFEYSQAEAKAKNEVSIRYADKALEVAKAELKRSLESIEQFPKSISQSQLDVEKLTIEKLTLEREQAVHELELERYGLQLKQAELDSAELQLQQHELVAPFAGRVVLIRGRVGEWVAEGAQVLRLVAVDRLRAEGFLPAEQAGADLIGKKVAFSVRSDGEREPVIGVVKFVSPEMETRDPSGADLGGDSERRWRAATG